MAVTDRKAHKQAMFTRHERVFYKSAVAVSQAGVLIGAKLPWPGYNAGEPAYQMQGFEVHSVEVWCTATAATASVDCQIFTDTAGVLSAGATVLSATITPVAGEAILGSILTGTSLPSRRGTLAQALGIVVTTNGSGTITDLMVTVIVRPFPLDNDGF